MTLWDSAAGDLSAAIAERRVDFHFQPQVDLASGMLVAFEGLARWTHETFGRVRPSEFIALSESNGSIHDLGRWVLDQCCRAGRRWYDDGVGIEVAVNVSPLQLGRPGFVQELERELERSALPPGSLILEVTEAERIDDVAVAAERLGVIAGWGVTVSIDDYGTGHSTLERATSLRAAELKIDRSLIADMDADRVQHAVAVAHDSGMRVVAEGIETAAHYDFARETGCDRGQGYYIGRPDARDGCDEWIREHPGDWRDAAPRTG